MSSMCPPVRLVGSAQEGKPERMKHLHTGPWYRWYLLLWIGLTYLEGVTVEVLGGQGSLVFFVQFTSLMFLHTVFHGLSPRLMLARRWYPIYAFAQGILVLALSLIVQGGYVSLLLTLSLLLALMIEATVILEQPRFIALTRGGYVSLLPVSILVAPNHSWQWTALDLLRVLLFVGPLLLFVVGDLLLYVHERRAHERTQRLLAQLEAAHAQVTADAMRIEELTRVAERERLARDLHDTLAQGVTGLIMQLEVVDSHLTLQNANRAQQIVKQAMLGARETLTRARRAIYDLQVEVTVAKDLPSVVEGDIQHLESITDISCTVDLAALEAIPATLHTPIRSMIAEGLTNVACHAQAHQLGVFATLQHDLLTVEVRDDGIGFDPAHLPLNAGHYGLRGLCERAGLAGGSLEIVSAERMGTTLRLHLPINGKGRRDE
jgi:two-component system, NarL family, sensor histidine kinase YdfH